MPTHTLADQPHRAMAGLSMGGVQLRELRECAASNTSVEELKNAGANADVYESSQTAHEWRSWRRRRHEFAPLLFQK